MTNFQDCSLRAKINFYLDDIETNLGKTINLSLLGLILLSSLIFVIETYPINSHFKTILTIIDHLILIIFTLEYLLRITCNQKPLKFLFSIFSLIDLFAILPIILIGIDVRFLRLFRWLRILRIIRFLDLEISIFKITTEDGRIITRILLIIFTIIFIYSGLIYQIEHNVNPNNFVTFLDALYFCVVTMTTVGFGDVTPLSQTGRFITLLMILTGIVVLPWQIGELLKQILKTVNQRNITCSQCQLSSHDQDAKYCKMCGTPLMEKSS